jgi:hypothetical protein
MESQINPAQEIPQSEIIGEIEYMLARIGTFRAELELEIWKKIASGEDTVEKIVSNEEWDHAGTQVLLDAICSIRLLKKEEVPYSLVPESESYLLPGKSTYKGDIVLNEYGWDGNGKFAEAIRSGKHPLQYDATTMEAVILWNADYLRSWVFPESYLETAKKL